jgi:hypothetical protein
MARAGMSCRTDVREVLEELWEEIFVAQLAGWFRDEQVWPQDLGFDAFCRWFDFQHHSMGMCIMQNEKYVNPFEDVHKKAKAFKVSIRLIQEDYIYVRLPLSIATKNRCSC